MKLIRKFSLILFVTLFVFNILHFHPLAAQQVDDLRDMETSIISSYDADYDGDESEMIQAKDIDHIESLAEDEAKYEPLHLYVAPYNQKISPRTNKFIKDLKNLFNNPLLRKLKSKKNVKRKISKIFKRATNNKKDGDEEEEGKEEEEEEEEESLTTVKENEFYPEVTNRNEMVTTESLYDFETNYESGDIKSTSTHNTVDSKADDYTEEITSTVRNKKYELTTKVVPSKKLIFGSSTTKMYSELSKHDERHKGRTLNKTYKSTKAYEMVTEKNVLSHATSTITTTSWTTDYVSDFKSKSKAVSTKESNKTVSSKKHEKHTKASTISFDTETIETTTKRTHQTYTEQTSDDSDAEYMETTTIKKLHTTTEKSTVDVGTESIETITEENESRHMETSSRSSDTQSTEMFTTEKYHKISETSTASFYSDSTDTTTEIYKETETSVKTSVENQSNFDHSTVSLPEDTEIKRTTVTPKNTTLQPNHTIPASDDDDNEETDESKTLDYENILPEYGLEIEEIQTENITYNFTDDQIEKSLKKLWSKILDIKKPRNCSQMSGWKFGIQALECAIAEFQTAKNRTEIRLVTEKVWKIVRVWLYIYIFIAVPCWCQNGWCCCCFRCKICFPRKTIYKEKKYFIENPPGVFIEANEDKQKSSTKPIKYEATVFEEDIYENFEKAIRDI